MTNTYLTRPSPRDRHKSSTRTGDPVYAHVDRNGVLHDRLSLRGATAFRSPAAAQSTRDRAPNGDAWTPKTMSTGA